MPAFAVTFAESALADLDAILDWYAKQHVPHVGQRLVAEILDQVEKLGTHPDMGRVVPEFGQTFLRELIRPPFRIVYRREAQRIRVVRVWRAERLLRLPDDENNSPV